MPKHPKPSPPGQNPSRSCHHQLGTQARQRGTNENTNGLLRQYRPRSHDFGEVTDRELDAIAAKLNERPRETLGWMTPSEKFSELVAMAA